MFKSISFDECLNYNAHDALEANVKSIVESCIKRFYGKKINDSDEYLKGLLKYILLQTATSAIWLICSKDLKFDQKYLYTVIKKHVYLAKPSLI
jgi:hypothetical protein